MELGRRLIAQHGHCEGDQLFQGTEAGRLAGGDQLHPSVEAASGTLDRVELDPEGPVGGSLLRTSARWVRVFGRRARSAPTELSVHSLPRLLVHVRACDQRNSAISAAARSAPSVSTGLELVLMPSAPSSFERPWLDSSASSSRSRSPRAASRGPRRYRKASRARTPAPWS